MSERIEMGVVGIESITYLALLAAMTIHLETIGRPGDILEVFDMKPHSKENPLHVNICLTINGVEVSLKSVLEQWMKNQEEHIREKASELIGERLQKFDDEMESLSKAIKEKAIATFPEYNPYKRQSY